MARHKPSQTSPAQPEVPPGNPWAHLTWDDLERWAGGGTVQRGRSYQTGGRVKNLTISPRGDLLATVAGTERYATTVKLDADRPTRGLESSCTCFVGMSCKHAVATVAEYLDAVAAGRDVPVASDADPRWASLSGVGDEVGADWNEDDDESTVSTVRHLATTDTKNCDARIEQHLRAKSHGELADLVWSLTRRFPEVYQEFRERIALQTGDADRLIAEARHAIREATAQPAWGNAWTNEGHTPAYDPVRHRFERLLEFGHADAVVQLGRTFLQRGFEQVSQSNDEGETLAAFAASLPVVFTAVNQSSLPRSGQLLVAIDALLEDQYDSISAAAGIVLDAPATVADWSAVADTLIARLKPAAVGDDEATAGYHRDYERDQITNWIGRALRAAERNDELEAIYTAEARATQSYQRLVDYLLAARRWDDAERWAIEGITATVEPYPGIAGQLAVSLAEVARHRQRWDVVAAHAARLFFNQPSPATFADLIQAAQQAKVEKPVRALALRFLETGVGPFSWILPPLDPVPPARPRSASKKSPALPAPQPAARLGTDPAWPLPVPAELLLLMERSRRFESGPRPHRDVLLEMALAAGKPAEIFRWYDQLRAGSPAGDYGPATHFTNRVAEAVAASHPERTIDIYQAGINDHLPHAKQSAYETVVGYLKKLRPIYASLDRLGEWEALVTSIRDRYKNRPKFRELLDRLDGRPTIQTVRPKRR